MKITKLDSAVSCVVDGPFSGWRLNVAPFTGLTLTLVGTDSDACVITGRNDAKFLAGTNTPLEVTANVITHPNEDASVTDIRVQYTYGDRDNPVPADVVDAATRIVRRFATAVGEHPHFQAAYTRRLDADRKRRAAAHIDLARRELTSFSEQVLHWVDVLDRDGTLPDDFEELLVAEAAVAAASVADLASRDD